MRGQYSGNTDLVHVVRSDDVWFPLVEYDDLVLRLAWTWQIVEVDPPVSLSPGLQVHGENQSVAVIQEVVGRLVIRHHRHGGVGGRDLEVVARLQNIRSFRDDGGVMLWYSGLCYEWYNGMI